MLRELRNREYIIIWQRWQITNNNNNNTVRSVICALTRTRQLPWQLTAVTYFMLRVERYTMLWYNTYILYFFRCPTMARRTKSVGSINRDDGLVCTTDRSTRRREVAWPPSSPGVTFRDGPPAWIASTTTKRLSYICCSSCRRPWLSWLPRFCGL